MSDTDHEHGHDEEERQPYEPENPQLPSMEPPLRSTAPQSGFTMGQVTRGIGVLLVGLALTFGLAVLLV